MRWSVFYVDSQGNRENENSWERCRAYTATWDKNEKTCSIEAGYYEKQKRAPLHTLIIYLIN